MEKKKSKKFSKLVITCGMLGLMMFGGPITQNNPLGQYMNTITNTIEAQAAETYSDNWKIDGSQNWWYYMDDGSLAKDAWIEDHGEWYLLGSDGMMRTGVVKSNGGRYYLLDTVRGTGTYGKLIKNGDVYQGITIKAEASGAYEGALSDETIAALKSIGVEVDNVVNVENTKHVSNGKVTSGNTGAENKGAGGSDDTSSVAQDTGNGNSTITNYGKQLADEWDSKVDWSTGPVQKGNNDGMMIGF